MATTYAACNSTSGIAKLTRFLVEITESCGDGTSILSKQTDKKVLFDNCIKVTGLGLGEEGTVTVPQWGVNGILADGQRTLSGVTLDFRVENSLPVTVGTTKTEILADMFDKRASSKYDLRIAITGRDFKAMFVYAYDNCDLRSFKSEDQEIGASKLGTVMLEFLPLDARLLACDNATVRVNGRSGATLPTTIGC